MQRRGYARHIKWTYWKDYPWYGWMAEAWKDDRIVEQMLESEKVIKTSPEICIIRNKETARKEHEDASENCILEEEI